MVKRPRPRYATKHLLARIEQDRDAGMTKREAADHLGVPLWRIQRICRRYGIRFERHRRFVLLVPDAMGASVDEECERRGVTAQRLVEQVVTTVVSEKLFAAILDN